MHQQHFQICSGDPTLVSYLAQYLQEPSCTILEDEGKFYLRSSYFQMLPTFTNMVHHTDALGSVLFLLDSNFDKLPTSAKREKCFEAIRLILNGIFKLKYNDYNGLTRGSAVIPIATRTGAPGADYEVDATGQRIYTAFKNFPMRFALGAGHDHFQMADQKRPDTKEIWDIARNTPAVARALFHYGKAEPYDIFNLRKVVEEIMEDTYTGSRKRVRYPEWKTEKWVQNAVGQDKMEELWEWLHNAYVNGDQASHSVAASFQGVKSITSSPQDAISTIRTLLAKWIEGKYKP